MSTNSAEALFGNVQDVNLTSKEAKNSRIEEWKKRLLDLTKRNTLLNFKWNKSTLSILAPDSTELIRKLFESNSSLTIRSTKSDEKLKAVNPVDKSDLEDKPVLQNESDSEELSDSEDNPAVENKSVSGLKVSNQIINDGLEYDLLYVDYTQSETKLRLRDINRKAQLSIDETGINTLYLALGMVEWSEKESEPVCNNAPIILIPVKLGRASISSEYTLSLLDNEPYVNMTLLEMLRQNWGKSIPDLDPNNLPVTETSTIDVDKIFQLFEAGLTEFPRWKVNRQALNLSNFSFQKFILWKELDSQQNILTSSNSVIEHLVNNANKSMYSDGIDIRPENQMDKISYKDICVPLGVDSSQLQAVIAAMDGASFVLNGPPGTGKSHTIANIIANSLYNGKSVIFVAEKKVALDVVYRRLKEIGLGSFCLELHSNKATKQYFYNQLVEAEHFSVTNCGDNWSDVNRQLEEKRQCLNQYVEHLHQRYHCGYSYYDAIYWGIKYPELIPIAQKLSREFPQRVTEMSKEELDNIFQSARDVQVAFSQSDFSTGQLPELSIIQRQERLTDDSWQLFDLVKNDL